LFFPYTTLFRSSDSSLRYSANENYHPTVKSFRMRCYPTIGDNRLDVRLCKWPAAGAVANQIPMHWYGKREHQPGPGRGVYRLLKFCRGQLRDLATDPKFLRRVL